MIWHGPDDQDLAYRLQKKADERTRVVSMLFEGARLRREVYNALDQLQAGNVEKATETLKLALRSKP